MPATLSHSRMGPSTPRPGLRPPNTCFLLLALLRFSVCWTRTSALRELIPPRPLPPFTSPPPPLFAGPPLYPTTVTVPPVFQKENNTELHSQVGTTAVLHCPTEHVGENTVSWVRRRDYHLLTVGIIVYSSDQRFSVRYISNEKDWQLHIRYVQKRDEGVYECQIATHPPISLLSTLHVVEATSEILGGPEKYMTTGSSLRLVCVLRKNTQPPSYVFWYHGDKMINYDTKVKVDTGGEVSVLFLGEVGPQSSGNYSCVPSNAQSSHIHVHVLRGGETPAAIHSGSAASQQPHYWLQSVGSLPLLSKWLTTCMIMMRNYPGFTPQTQSSMRYFSNDTSAKSSEGFKKYSAENSYSLFDSNENGTHQERTMLPTAKQLYRGNLAKLLQSKLSDSTKQDTQSIPLFAYFILGGTPAAFLSIAIVCLHYVIICKVLLQYHPQRTECREKENSKHSTLGSFDYQRGRQASSCVDLNKDGSYDQVQLVHWEQREVTDLPTNVLAADPSIHLKFKKPTARPLVGCSWKHHRDYVECSIHPVSSESVCLHASYDAEARFWPEICSGSCNGNTKQYQ